MTKKSASEDTLRIPAIVVEQLGSKLIMTKMSIEQLGRFLKADLYDSGLNAMDEDQGYQRPWNESRSRQIEQYMTGEAERTGSPRMPGTILCSARTTDLEVKDGHLTILPYHRLHIVDGQHRAGAYALALKNKTISGIDSYEIPVTIMMNISKIEEMRQFDKINSMQKAVDGSLTAQLLEIVEANGGVLTKKEEQRAVLASVVRRMNDDDDSPFRQRIVMPDSRRSLGRVTKAKTLQDSIRQIDSLLFDMKIDSVAFKLRVLSVYNVVHSIWEALLDIQSLRTVFINSDTHALQQAGGVSIIHLLAYSIMRNYMPPTERANKTTWNQLFMRSKSLCDPTFWDKGTTENGIMLARGAGAKATGNGGFTEINRLLLEEINPEEFFSNPRPTLANEGETLTVIRNSDVDDVFTVDLTKEATDEIDIPTDISLDGNAHAHDGTLSPDASSDLHTDTSDSNNSSGADGNVDIHPAVHDTTENNVLVLAGRTKTNRLPHKKR